MKPLILCLLATAAHAEPQCAKHQAVVEMLAKQFGEAPHDMGMAAKSALMEMYASTDTGTWTLLITLPNGITCIIAAGDSFETVAASPQGDPA